MLDEEGGESELDKEVSGWYSRMVESPRFEFPLQVGGKEETNETGECWGLVL